MNGNFDKQKLISAILSESGGKITESDLKKLQNGDFSALSGALGSKDAAALLGALKNKDTAQKILKSEDAKKILERFLSNKKNG